MDGVEGDSPLMVMMIMVQGFFIFVGGFLYILVSHSIYSERVLSCGGL